MNLSLKATRFVIEALQYYRKYHDRRLEQNGLSEDTLSDLENDRLYLDAIQHDFEKYQDQLMQQHEGIQADV